VDDRLRQKARSVPREPGVYLWKDAQSKILYVGKAQDLRARVAHYLGPQVDEKHRLLQDESADLDFVAMTSVKEALILEQNLIKQHRPPYNVLLVDDKKYPYIAVTEEKFPRVVYTRDLREKGSFFGPFPDAWGAKRVSRMVNKMFQLRQCRTLPARECLYYHLHQCSGPCIGAVTPAEYKAQAARAEEFLQGRGVELSKHIKGSMEQAAQGQRFEEAAELRDLASAIDSVLERQHAESATGRSYDAIGIAIRDDRACALVLFVREGMITGREVYMLNRVQGESLAVVLLAFLEQYYPSALKLPPEILLPVELGDGATLTQLLTERRGARVQIRAPERGEGRRFVELAEKNAHLAIEQELLLRERRGSAAMEELQRALGLPTAPELIEAFDISHHAGQYTVASMVCLKDGQPYKSGYRRFRIRTTQGGDDPGAMREVVLRRYTRVLQEVGADALPDLILIDGGRPQLGAAYDALKSLGLEATPIVGLAKRFEELYRPQILHPLKLDPHSAALQALQRVRDEAHRFAIGYQGVLKRKNFITSALDEIPGVGPERRRRLLQTFGSVDAIRSASEEELARTPGINRPLAKRIRDALRSEDAPLA
jgi:excinuclease ABC subunit C